MATNSSAITNGDDSDAAQMNNVRLDAITRKTRYTFPIKSALAIENDASTSYLVPIGMTVKRIGHKLAAGTATITVKKNGSTDVEANISVTSSFGEVTSGFDSDALAEGDRLTINVTAVSSASDLDLFIECEEIFSTSY
jgi:hypothetical protein